DLAEGALLERLPRLELALGEAPVVVLGAVHEQHLDDAVVHPPRHAAGGLDQLVAVVVGAQRSHRVTFLAVAAFQAAAHSSSRRATAARWREINRPAAMACSGGAWAAASRSHA